MLFCNDWMKKHHAIIITECITGGSNLPELLHERRIPGVGRNGHDNFKDVCFIGWNGCKRLQMGVAHQMGETTKNWVAHPIFDPIGPITQWRLPIREF